MKLTLDHSSMLIERETTDPKIYKESTFFFRLKNALQKKGLDCIYKDASKDGHLMEGYYIRDRKWRWCMTDDDYAIRNAYTSFNASETIRMTIHNWKNYPIGEVFT